MAAVTVSTPPLGIRAGIGILALLVPARTGPRMPIPIPTPVREENEDANVADDEVVCTPMSMLVLVLMAVVFCTCPYR